MKHSFTKHASPGNELQALLDKIVMRLMRMLTRKGYLIEEQGMTYLGENVFFNDTDRAAYLEWLAGYCAQYEVTVLAYCLITNHIRVVAVPQAADALRKVFRKPTGSVLDLARRPEKLSRLSRLNDCSGSKAAMIW